MTISVSSLSTQTRVNEETLDPQRLTDVIQLSGGDYLVTYQASGHAYYRAFSADGTAKGASVEVASTGSDLQGAALANGGFVLVWEQFGGVGYNFVGQKYDASGNAVGGTFQVNAAAINYQADVSVVGLQDGGFLAVWQVDGNPAKVGVQRFDSAGAKIGGETQFTGGSPKALALAGGGYVLQYTSGASGVVTEIFNAAGVSLSKPAIAYGELAALTNGGFVASWVNSNTVYAQTFDAAGVATSSAVRVDNIAGQGSLNHSTPSVAAADDGSFTLVWMAGPNYGPWKLYTRQFDSAGQPLSDSAPVNTTGAGMPFVTALPGGDVVIVWNGDEIYQARVSPGGDGPLTAGPQLAVGDGADDTFLALPGSLGQGDQIDGQGGYDTVQLTAQGTLDFSEVTISNVERVRGSAGDDILIFDGALPQGLALDSGGGADTLRLTGEVDLAGLSLTGAWTLESGAGQTVMTLGSSAQVAVIHGGEGPLTVDAGDVVLTAAERAQLFQQGVDQIVDADLAYFASDTAVAGAGFFKPVASSWENVPTPQTIGLAGGDYLMVWERSIQRFNGDGSPDGAVVTLADTSAGTLAPRGVGHGTGLPGGGYVVTWTQGGAVYAQLFDASGQAVGGHTKVNTTDNASWEDAAPLSDGGFVVTWGSDVIRGQRFSETGTAVGGEFAISAPGQNSGFAQVAGLSDGGFAVVWSRSSSGGQATLITQRYDSGGQKAGGETVVDSGSLGNTPLITSVPGGYAVAYHVWGPTEGVSVRVYGNDGTLVASHPMFGDAYSTYMASVTLSSGDFLVAWTDHDGFSVQRFTSDGEIAGAPDHFTAGTMAELSLSALADDGYVVTYEHSGLVHQQVFTQYNVASLTSGTDGVAGDSRPTLLDVSPQALTAGDTLVGGGGEDVVRLASAGTYNLDAPASLQGFESLWGSAGDDVVTISAARLAQFAAIDGREGHDELRLTTTGSVDLSGAAGLEAFVGSAGDDTVRLGAARPENLSLDSGGGTDTLLVSGFVDLADLDLTGDWRISAAPGDAATLILTDVSQVAWAWGLGSTVTVDASAVQLTASQRQTLFDQGIDYLVQQEAVFTPLGGLSRLGSNVSSPGLADTAPLPGGGFLGVSVSYQGASGYDIKGAVFDADGVKVGSDFDITTAAGDQFWPTVVPTADGVFVAWTSQGNVNLQRLDTTGAKIGSETLLGSVSGGNAQYLSLSPLGGGGYLAVWIADKASGDELQLQRIDAAGASVGGVQTIASGLDLNRATTAVLADGSLVLVWADGVTNIAGDGGVWMQRFDATGATLGGAVQISAGIYGEETQPVVAALTDGGYVVAWVNDSIYDNGGLGIYVQRYDSMGVATGEPRLVNERTADYQNLPQIVGLADGGYVVSWNGYLQRYDSQDTPVGGQIPFTNAVAGESLPFGGLAATDSGFFLSSQGSVQLFTALDLHALTTGADTVLGNARDTWVIAQPGTLGAADSVSGGAGVDVFEQGAAGTVDIVAPASFSGFERLRGTDGDDTWIVSGARLSGVTHIALGEGRDALTLGAAGTLDLTGVTVTGVERILGTNGADTITGSAAADVIDGGGGNDVLKGGGGFDTVSYESALAAVSVDLRRTTAQDTGGGGVDTLSQFLGLTGSSFDDILTGSSQANALDGALGSDVLYGLAGNDVLRDGGETANRDFLFGGRGNDTYYVTSSLTGPTDLVFEGGDNPDLMAGVSDIDSILSGGAFFWDYYGVGERLYIATDAGSQIVGGTNNQQFFGGAGSDQIIVYGGSNRVDAGAGTDAVSFGLYGLAESYDGVNTLVMKAGSGMDYVYEFESGLDKVDLSAFNFGITGAQVLAQAVNVDQAGTENDYCYFYLTSAGGVDNFVVFIGLLSSQLQASDFIT